MTTEAMTVDREGFKRAARKGVTAAALLSVLTIIEYSIAIGLPNPLLPLIPFVVVKGWIILDTFMHVRAVFGDGDH
ncbi:MAG: hypothetical protein QGD95_08175 [Actinomycetota bacterium]|nr:hypothetical protein [Actinomycetota bacterium]